ncbi:hypothetical protein KP509_08G019000 [Ceratopteris richardii]|uniref:C3H1-type domain-containing protein n=1 Tax=Ceratopteris richardii TaxID=49495 RepID=A0A8T2UEK1_CERRI|nr:hypothetical protein KP509_08G019000 [Ceratopteris richardii]
MGAGEALPPNSTVDEGVADGHADKVVDETETEDKRDTAALEAQQTRNEDPLFKTSLCSFFRKLGNCRHALQCKYAHGEEELRRRPDGSWDPTSLRGRPVHGQGSEHPAKIKQSKQEDTEKDDEENEGEDEEELEEAQENGSYGGGNHQSSLCKCIRELPLRWTSEELNKLLAEKGLAFCSSRKRKHSSVAFVEFECDQHASSAKEKLDGILINSKLLKVVDATSRSGVKKRASGDPEQSFNLGTNKNMDICDVVTPLAKFPYEEQLEKKRADISQILKKLGRNVRKAISPNVPLPQWVIDAKLRGGLCCQFDGVVASPQVDGYRNKCEFTVGHSIDGKRTVGFLLGNFREGCSFVMEPVKCRNVSQNARMYANAFQNFVQNSELPVWDKTTSTGFWRLFTVREGHAACEDSQIAEIMLIVQICSAGIEESRRKLEFEHMAHSLVSFASEACLPLSALLVQDHLGISNAASPDAPLLPLSLPDARVHSDPKTVIHDHICSLRFRLSPTAFFQVNTRAAEKLYTMAGDWANLDSDTLLFDVCCGTGTIGLTLANRVGMVIGIELNDAAVADARVNAEINGIKNCRFVCGKAEDVMQNLLDEYLLNEEKVAVRSSHTQSTDDAVTEEPSKEADADAAAVNSNDMDIPSRRKFKSVVVLVDPPRSGLHPVVLKLLRIHEKIRRLVYVSCNPETLLANAVELCTPSGKADEEKGSGQRGPWRLGVVGLARQRIKSMPASMPFSPVKAVAVDMFPHTPHCEVIMLMER